MVNVLYFLWGFTSVVSVYEIAKTNRKTNSDKFKKAVDRESKYVK